MLYFLNIKTHFVLRNTRKEIPPLKPDFSDSEFFKTLQLVIFYNITCVRIFCYLRAWIFDDFGWNKTCVINDPFGQTHSLASSDHYFLLFRFAKFEKWGRTYGLTDSMCKNNDHYRPGLWVGRVDQLKRFLEKKSTLAGE